MVAMLKPIAFSEAMFCLMFKWEKNPQLYILVSVTH